MAEIEWPEPKIFKYLHNRIGLVVDFGQMGHHAGILSSVDHLVYGPGFLYCRGCNRQEGPENGPPTSRGLNGKAEPLFGPQTMDFATWTLTWLYPASRKHLNCV